MADVTRAALDTSVLIRHLTGDDPAKATRVRGLLAREEVAELLEAVLATPGLSVPDRPVLAEAVAAYRNHGIDFTDAWIAAVARAQGYTTVYTFDRRHFARLQGIHPETP